MGVEGGDGQGAAGVDGQERKVQEKKQDDGKVSGLNALTSVGFGGALANRGRGRGRGRGAPSNRFPQTFNPSNLKESEKSAIAEQEQKANDQTPKDPAPGQPANPSDKLAPSQQQ